VVESEVIEGACGVRDENSELCVLGGIRHRRCGDESGVVLEIDKAAGSALPVDAIEDGIAEAHADGEEEREQQQEPTGAERAGVDLRHSDIVSCGKDSC